MENKKTEKTYYLAKMYYGNGISNYFKITKSDKDIFFVRNIDGVNAWHCGSLPINDYRILEIIPYDEKLD
jgi:hypothetical protein